MRHKIVGKIFEGDAGLVGARCKLILANGKTIVGVGIYGETLNQHKVGDTIVVGPEVEQSGEFGYPDGKARQC